MSEQYRLPSIIPEQLASVSESFVEFIKAYYAYMNQEGMPSYLLENSVVSRDVFQAVDKYLDVLYKELGHEWISNRDSDRANLISSLDEIYKARGSLDSIKVLFRSIFGEEVTIKLPKEFILKPSTGAWVQDYSIIAQLDDGDIQKIVGQFCTVTTFFPGAPDQVFNVEIKRINVRDQINNIYELFISRYYVGFFYWGSTIEYQDVKMTLVPSLSAIVDIPTSGAKFKLGESYNIPHYDYNYSYDYIDNTLYGPTRTEYLDRVGSLYLEKTFQRWYKASSNVEPNKIEYVTRQHYANGSSVEFITRDDITKTTITRGQREVSQIKAIDGSTSIKSRLIATNIVATNKLVNWDAIIQKLINRIVFADGGDLHNFFTEVPSGEAFQRADINNDGVIDIEDVVLLARRALGYNVSEATRAWVDDYIGQAVLDQELNAPFQTASGTGCKIRVISTDETGGLTKARIVTFGYNYPLVYTVPIMPETSTGESAEVTLLSNPVGVTAAEYKDRRGFLSDIIKIQDNDYYQEFSYAVESSQNPTTAERSIKQTVHPAGLKLFAEQVITNAFDVADLSLTVEHHFADPVRIADLYKHLAFELLETTDSIDKYYTKNRTESLEVSETYNKVITPGTKTENTQLIDLAKIVTEEPYVEATYFYDDFDYVSHWTGTTYITPPIITVTTSGTALAGQADITLTTSAGVELGYLVFLDTYIPDNTYVQAINGNVITLSRDIDTTIPDATSIDVYRVTL